MMTGLYAGMVRESEVKTRGPMLDFTSSLYLGLRHPSGMLRPWAGITTGRPAVLAEPPGTESVAFELAALQGCERAILAPSTLHLFWDLCGMLDRRRTTIYLDAGAYPTARWGVERAAGRGVPVRTFAHHDPADLRRRMRSDVANGGAPLVVTDGFCPVCGRAAPLEEYLNATRARGGQLVVDDTQALGVLGIAPYPDVPYGHGGGGSLHWLGIGGREILVISSMAKGFGVPLAALTGSAETMRRFEERSETRIHCSPPSAATIRAAQHALAVNRRSGELLRRRLWQLVRLFCAHLGAEGLTADGGNFPVQTLVPAHRFEAGWLHRRLLRRGLLTIPGRGHHGEGGRINLVITALHTPEQIERAAATLAGVLSIGAATH